MGYIKYIREKVGHSPIFMPAVGCVIYKDGKILLQKRADTGDWAMHGGSMEFGEEVLDTLKRELKEELNIEPVNPVFAGVYSGEKQHFRYPNEDEVYVTVFLFLVNDYNGNINFNDGEVIDLKWYDINNLPENIFIPDRTMLKDIKEFIDTGKINIK